MNNIIQTIRHTARAATVLLMTVLTTMTAWADSPYGHLGSGTSDDPYQITSASDLIQLRTEVNGGTGDFLYLRARLKEKREHYKQLNQQK